MRHIGTVLVVMFLVQSGVLADDHNGASFSPRPMAVSQNVVIKKFPDTMVSALRKVGETAITYRCEKNLPDALKGLNNRLKMRKKRDEFPFSYVSLSKNEAKYLYVDKYNAELESGIEKIDGLWNLDSRVFLLPHVDVSTPTIKQIGDKWCVFVTLSQKDYYSRKQCAND